jgi:hypothetical protein
MGEKIDRCKQPTIMPECWLGLQAADGLTTE